MSSISITTNNFNKNVPQRRPMKRRSSSSGKIATIKSERIVHDYLHTDLTFEEIAIKHKVPTSTVSNIVYLYETEDHHESKKVQVQPISEVIEEDPQYRLKNTNYKLVWHMSIEKACKHSLSINKENNNIVISSHHIK